MKNLSFDNNRNSNYYNSVKEFHLAFKHPAPNVSVYSFMEKSDIGDLIKFRVKLIKEEFNELEDGFKKNNRKELADGLTDLLYVVVGTLIALGLPDCINNFIYSEFISDKDNTVDTRISIDILRHHIIGIEKRINMNLDKLQYILSQMVIEIYNISVQNKINLNKTFDIIHKNNMSKICKTEREACETVLKYKNLGIETMVHENAGYYVVVRTDDGKIMKSINWKEPDLSSVI